MKIVVRAKADKDLDGIFAWIVRDNPRAAAEIIRRIRTRIGRLATPGLEHIGRPGIEPGTRELVEAPYIVVYEVHESETRSRFSLSCMGHETARIRPNPTRPQP